LPVGCGDLGGGSGVPAVHGPAAGGSPFVPRGPADANQGV